MTTDENIEHAALGVLILWFAWFAFNCGSTENIQGKSAGRLRAVVDSCVSVMKMYGHV